MEEKNKEKNRKEQIEDISKRLEEGVKNIYQNGHYEKFLQMVSRLPQHSYRNTMLIYMQNPEANYVAGFKKWQEFNRHVRKGEKGIRIFAPMTYKKEEEKAQTGDQKSKTKEVTIVGFKPVYVFDISQTDGEPLPMIPHRLEANISNFSQIMKALEKISPYPISYEQMNGKINGYYSKTEKRIAINKELSEAHSIKTAIHEITHARIHGDEAEKISRKTKEIEAESVAYIVTNYYGIDSSDYSFGYIAGWAADQELSQLQESMKIIQKQANELMNDLDQAFQELGILTSEEKQDPEAKEEKLKTKEEQSVLKQLKQAKEQLEEQQPVQKSMKNQLHEMSL